MDIRVVVLVDCHCHFSSFRVPKLNLGGQLTQGRRSNFIIASEVSHIKQTNKFGKPVERSGVGRSVGSRISFQPLEIEQLLQFERKGHLCVRALFDTKEMVALEAAIHEAATKEKLNAYRHRVAVLCPGVDPFSLHSITEAEAVIRQKGTDDVGFLQNFNLHLKSQDVRQWSCHPRMVSMVAELLGAKRLVTAMDDLDDGLTHVIDYHKLKTALLSSVRLYQDCLFLKMPGFGVTNWHSDLNMVPIDTNSFLTVWIPLRSLDKTDSSLHFASGSHKDFALPYWQNNQGMMNLENRCYPEESHSNMILGDVTVHHGWTLHCAPGQPVTQPARAAWTVSYFADGARLLQTKYARRKLQEEDTWSFKKWRNDLKEGQLARHSLLPVVYPLDQIVANRHRKGSLYRRS